MTERIELSLKFQRFSRGQRVLQEAGLLGYYPFGDESAEAMLKGRRSSVH